MNNNFNISRNNKYLILIFFIFLFHLINNAYVLNLDQTPYVYDMANLRLQSLNYFDALNNHNYKNIISLYSQIESFYPPLITLTSLPFYYIFGTTQNITSLSNLFYFFILLYSMYFIGKKIASEQVGLLSSLIVSFIPGIYSFSRVFMPDFALTAIVMLSISLMINSNYFKKKIITILFGLSLSLGMLIKWSFLIYMIGPFIIYFFMAFDYNDIITKKIFFNKRFLFFLIIIFIAVLIALTWYLNKIPFILNRVQKLNHDYSIQINGFNSISKNDFRFYTDRIKNTLFLNFHNLFLFGFISYILFHKDKYKLLLCSSILIAYITFTFSAWKATRYILPIIPLFSIFLSITLIKPLNLIKHNKGIKSSMFYLILLLVMIIFLFSYININYSGKNIRSFSPTNLFSEGLYRPHNINYQINDMIISIKNNSKGNEKILILPNSDLFDALYHEFKFQKLSYSIDRGYFCIGSGGENNCRPNDFNNYKNKNYVCSFDYVINYKDEFSYELYGLVFQPKNSSIHKDVFEPLINNWYDCKNSFELINEFNNQTDTSNRHIVTIQIYKKNENY
jgi:4-amino-4-deoxy-L-arabinose transferase-like glycosyltransferase